ncbi:MAG: Na+/H+ antiporter [Alphaproteobacteria bacterium]|nr:Na+/H+ antiporter [Alphaproteobacteria bacterium]
MLHAFETMLTLLALTLVLGLAAKRTPLPPAVALVLGGMAIGFLPGLPDAGLDPQLTLVLFLPPLLFYAAYFTSWREFKSQLRPILLLAVGLVLATTAGVGWVTKQLVPDLPWAVAFAFGAIVSPPDAVAASAVLQRLRIPKRIVTIIEGESLINDASGLVLYKFAVAAALTGAFSAGEAAATFVAVSIGGTLIGLALGFALVSVLRRMTDTLSEIVLSFLVPYGAYILAEQFHMSGVLAVVAAGLVLGWSAPEVLTAETRIQAKATWDSVVFMLNGLVFVLIGLELDDIVDRLDAARAFDLAWIALAVSGASIAIRLVWVFAATYLPRWALPSLRARDPYPPWQHAAVVGWVGMRGVVSLAAALALPTTLAGGVPFPGRDIVVFMTFVVILVTLVGQGTSLALLIDWLNVKEEAKHEVTDAIARKKMAHAAVETLESFGADDIVRLAARGFVIDEYTRRLSVVGDPESFDGDPEVGLESGRAVRELRLLALAAERRRLLKLRRERLIDDEALSRLQTQLDHEEVLIGHGRV